MSRRGYVETFDPALVVLDTLADSFAGDENRAQARQFIGLLRGVALKHDLTMVVVLARGELCPAEISIAIDSERADSCRRDRLTMPGEWPVVVRPERDGADLGTPIGLEGTFT